jgi:mono/diheme cytochrome c family protein
MNFKKCFAVWLVAASAMVLAAVQCGAAKEPGPGVANPPAAVTFNKHIAPLLFQHCATCHRPGEVAPFPLLTYADARKRAQQLQTVTADRFMPPWKSVAGHGEFLGERRLSKDEIALFARWFKQGAPEGNAADLPAAPRFTDGWQLGQPDLVVTMPQEYEIPAEGPDVYRNFVLPLEIPAGKYIQAVEFRPTNRRIVHHAVLAYDVTGRCRQQDDADPAPGFKGGLNIPGQLFAGGMSTWTPGREPSRLPEGLSMPWKSGADFVLQLHLHPSGKPEAERSSIGFYFTDVPPQRSTVDLLMIDKKIDIPPGERAYRTRDEFTVPVDVDVLGIFPHMHLIGRDFKVTAHPPQGDSFSLLWINDWDFNWQNFYQYAAPVRLTAGTRVVLEGVHDNSAENFRNPSSPPARVSWGEETTNEMTVAFLQSVLANEDDVTQLTKLRQRVLGFIPAAKDSRPAK